jgi:hypothetical protein
MKIVVTPAGTDGDIVVRPDPLSTGRWSLTTRVGEWSVTGPADRTTLVSLLRMWYEAPHIRVEVTRG